MAKSRYATSARHFVLAAAMLVAWPNSFLQAADQIPARSSVRPYPLDVCLVSGELLGADMGEPHVFVVNGQEIKLCCKSCLEDFQKDKKAMLAKVAEASRKVKPYPLDSCIVSGEKLGGGMGEPLVLVYKRQEIKFCCKDCLEEFKKDRDGVLKKIVAASEKK